MWKKLSVCAMCWLVWEVIYLKKYMYKFSWYYTSFLHESSVEWQKMIPFILFEKKKVIEKKNSLGDKN